MACLGVIGSLSLSSCSDFESPSEPVRDDERVVRVQPAPTTTTSARPDSASTSAPGGHGAELDAEVERRIVDELVQRVSARMGAKRDFGHGVIGVPSGVAVKFAARQPRSEHVTQVELALVCRGRGVIDVQSRAGASHPWQSEQLRCQNVGSVVQFFHEVELGDLPEFKLTPRKGALGQVAYGYNGVVFYDDPAKDPMVKSTR